MMTLFKRATFQGLRSIFLLGVVAGTVGFAGFARAQVQFEAPDSSIPSSSIGGGTRGNSNGNNAAGSDFACGMEFENPEELASNPTAQEDGSVEMSFLNPEEISSALTPGTPDIEDSEALTLEEAPSDEMVGDPVHLSETCKQHEVTDDVDDSEE